MLTERQKNIMIAIVEAYTESSVPEPIGSSTLTKLQGLNFSSATLRNEMAALEEMGYLEKTHTSSGRIPSEKGYRLYIDELMNIEPMMPELDEQVNNFLCNVKGSKSEAVYELIKNIISSKEFNYSAVTLEKTAYNCLIKKVDFVHLHNHRGLFILVTDNGLVFSKEALIPENIHIKNVVQTMEFLNSNFHNMLLNDFKNAKRFEIVSNGFFDYMSGSEAVIELCLRNMKELVKDKKSLIGQYNILNHPEFENIQTAQAYLDCLKTNDIYKIVEFDNGPIPVIGLQENVGISIKIGHENALPIMQNCSTITAYYESKNGTGAITIYGPLRMKYRYVIALLSAIVRSIQ